MILLLEAHDRPAEARTGGGRAGRSRVFGAIGGPCQGDKSGDENVPKRGGVNSYDGSDMKHSFPTFPCL
jgi:hypothetical protein